MSFIRKTRCSFSKTIRNVITIYNFHYFINNNGSENICDIYGYLNGLKINNKLGLRH